MSSQTEYLHYNIQLILAVLGVSASYLIDLSNPTTLSTLIFVPILFGHTSYISKKGFNNTSLITLITLIFSLVGGITAIMSVIYSIGNIMVSMFSGGTKFKDFYASTSIPLLAAGLMIGASIFGYSIYKPDFREQKINETSQHIGKAAETTFANSSLVEKQKNNQLRLINQTAKTTVLLTNQKILTDSNPSTNVRTSLMEAETEIPDQVYQQAKQNMEKQRNPLSQRVSQIFKDSFSGSKFILIIPLTAGFLYSLQPVIGIMTAIFSKIFLSVGRIET